LERIRGGQKSEGEEMGIGLEKRDIPFQKEKEPINEESKLLSKKRRRSNSSKSSS